MANQAKLTIRVSATRGATTIDFSTTGRYVSFTTGGLGDTLTKQPIMTTASQQAFWLQVLGLVQAEITASEAM